MIGLRKHRLRRAVAAIGTAAVALGGVFIGPAHGAGAPSASATATVSVPFQPARPYWIELTQPQRQALEPLAADWERLDPQTKKKWVEIANRYPRMTTDERDRTQQRMREWALLTPDQRRVARDSFARVRAMTPEQRADMLRKYHELPNEKKQALTTEGRASKAIVVPKPMTTLVPRRTELHEGAKVRNPAVAAQKGANPAIAPSRPPASPVDEKARAVEPLPAAASTPASTPPSTPAPAPPPTPAPPSAPAP